MLAGNAEDSKETAYASREEGGDFFMHKRDMLLLARGRLDKMLGEDTPISARWGMLLSKPEQDQLTQMHEQAFAQTAKQTHLS